MPDTTTVEREPRCRMLTRLGDRCPNPALDPDPAAVQICVRHAARVLELVRERQAMKATTKEGTKS